MATSNSLIIGDDDWMVSEVPDVPFWNETMATVLTDPDSGMASCFYIGRWWAEPTILRAMLAFALPGDRALFSRNYGRSPEPRLPSAAGFTMRPRPDRTIDFSYDGPMDLRSQSEVSCNGLGYGPTIRAKMHFTFTPLMPIWDMFADTAANTANPMFPAGHKEQLGQLHGILEFEGETFEVSRGFAFRDHSRGVRNYAKHHSHILVTGRFPGGWGFCAFKSRAADGNGLNKAMIFRDGKMIPATFETDGLEQYRDDIWRSFDVRLVTGTETIEVRVDELWNSYQLGLITPADPHWGVPLGADNPPSTWAQEQSIKLRCGNELGYGNLERCSRDVVLDQHWRSMFPS